MADLWYKDAVVYCLDVESFQDSSGDGVGDFGGVVRRLDHLQRLGVTCLWLLPFYPTPNRDNGYDVTDYYSVDPRLGTPGDFVELVRECRERGLRILVDLVVNHTSIDHPWFRSARSDPDSRYRDWYVWREDEPDDPSEGVVFPGVQERVWTYDEEAELYYFHRFYEHQPDLNISNPEVRAEIERIMGYWLELGVSGFRLDAAPFLIELKGIDAPGVTDPYDYLQEFRRFLSLRRGDAILLAEANVAAEKVADYFGDELKLHMLFDFIVNQHLFLALARRNAMPLVKGFHRSPAARGEDQWAHFLRNHDELDLGRLSEEQRREVFDAFAPDPSMRLYDRGIRRRLAPMLGGDPARLRMANSLLLSLPGTPVIRYGQEIGMGEDLSLEERDAVRTPMQWSDAENAGFSTAPADALPRPVVASGPFGYREVNVDAQRRDPDSLLRWMQEAVRARRESPEIGRGEWTVLETGDPAVFAHACTLGGSSVVAVHNLDADDAEVRVDVSDLPEGAMRPVFGATEAPDVQAGMLPLELEGWGYRWYRRGGDA